MKKLIVGHSKFVLAVGGWLEPSIILWTEGDRLPVHKAIICWLVSWWWCQRNTRCETGRGPNILLLRFAREFAVDEILMLLHLQHLLPFPFLPPSYFFSSTLFPWPSTLLHATSLPLLCSVSACVCSYSCGLSCSEGRGKGHRMMVEPPSGDWGHVPGRRPWHLFITLRLPGLACSLPCNNSACFQFF